MHFNLFFRPDQSRVDAAARLYDNCVRGMNLHRNGIVIVEEDAQLLAQAVADEPGLNRILEEEGE